MQLLELTLPPGATTRYLDVLVPYAERAWNEARDPATGLFHFGRAQPGSLLNQAAAVRLFALLATDQPPGPFADNAFLPTWHRADAPIVAGQTARGWLWGPAQTPVDNGSALTGARLAGVWFSTSTRAGWK